MPSEAPGASTKLARAGRLQNHRNFPLAVGKGRPQRRHASRVGNVGIGVVSQECLSYVFSTIHGREHQRGAARGVACVDIDVLVNRRLHSSDVTGCRRLQE